MTGVQTCALPIYVDPLRVPDAINESELMDVLIDVHREYAGLLLYAGGSLQLDVGNAFLLVARRLSALTWSRPMGPASGELAAHCVGGTAPMPVNGSRRFDLISLYSLPFACQLRQKTSCVFHLSASAS